MLSVLGGGVLRGEGGTMFRLGRLSLLSLYKRCISCFLVSLALVLVGALVGVVLGVGLSVAGLGGDVVLISVCVACVEDGKYCFVDRLGSG